MGEGGFGRGCAGRERDDEVEREWSEMEMERHGGFENGGWVSGSVGLWGFTVKKENEEGEGGNSRGDALGMPGGWKKAELGSLQLGRGC